MAAPTSESYSVPSATAIYVGRPAPGGGGGGSPPSSELPTDKYRFQQPLLFQRAHQKFEQFSYFDTNLGQEVVVPGVGFYYDGSTNSTSVGCGANNEMICTTSYWRWTNQGSPTSISGDWVDANGVQQGTTPFSQTGVFAAGAPAAVTQINVTSAVQAMFTRKTWMALMLQVSGTGQVDMVGPLNTVDPKTTLLITYTDNTSETLDLWFADTLAKSPYTRAQNDWMTLTTLAPGVLEFYREATPKVKIWDNGKTVATATLNLSRGSVVGGTVQLSVYLVAPILPASLVPTPGLAASYPLDVGLFARSDVLVQINPTDASIMADVLDEKNSGQAYSKPWLPGQFPVTHQQEAMHDPTLWADTPGSGLWSYVSQPTPTQLAQLLPQRNSAGNGTKLIGKVARQELTMTQDVLRLVKSNDALALSRGFTPLAPGVGALELLYPTTGLSAGQGCSSGVTTGGYAAGGSDTDLYAYFKRDYMGRAVDVYLRMYIMLGPGWEADTQKLPFFYHGSVAENGKYPSEIGRSVSWIAHNRSGKFPGGVQQVTSQNVVYEAYQYPTRLDGSNQPNDTKITITTAGGGYSKTAGPFGYQGRWAFMEGYHHSSSPGPAVGGIALCLETVDWREHQGFIPSQAETLGLWDTNSEAFATGASGLGYIYPGKWYCVEFHWKMNTMKLPYELPPRGTDWREGGHNVDGYFEWEIDGIKSHKSPLCAHRTSAMMLDWALQHAQGRPLDQNPASPIYFRPVTNVPPELAQGAAEVVLQCYYGGQTPNIKNKYVYLAGIVATEGQRIGPMAGVSRIHGGLGA